MKGETVLESQDLLDAIDIVDYVSQFVDLEEKNGEYWGISPFTVPPERTPSFSVRRETGKFYDFSSGLGGNVITFAMKYHGVPYYRAAEILKNYAGISGDIKAPVRLQATRVAKRFGAPRPEKSCDSSTLPADYMERYEFDTAALKLWADEGIPYDIMRRFGVRYDSFSKRIVYPIRNAEGDIINVSGRTVEKDYKEKGLPKYTYYKPLGAVPAVYGLWENREAIRNANEVILFEGAKSVMLACSWGIENCAAALTSHLSPRQFKILVSFGVPVTVAFDAEIDPRKDENIKKLRHYLPVCRIKNCGNLLEAKDAPVDKGREVFETLYRQKERM